MEIPTFKVFITPQFDEDDHATGLQIILTISSSQVEEDSTLVEFPTLLGDVLIEDGLLACDEDGILPVVREDTGSVVRWNAARKAFGDLKIHYRVSSSSSDEFKSRGPVVGLHRDSGGLLGSGFAFIPSPPLFDAYHNIVEWDLSQAPKGTRAVWTYGEGPLPIEKTGPAALLRDTVYMVGRIHSKPPGSVPSSTCDYYGYYWFGELPPNITVIRDIHLDFFLKVSDFFDDPPSQAKSHRSFVRNTGDVKSFGGTSFMQSHIFDYDNQINIAEDYDLVRRMSYEIVHRWLGPPVTDKEIDWLYEGIKNCLSIYMPFRNKFRTGLYFQATINMLCTRYYTSPLVEKSVDEILKLAPADAYAREHLSARAWAFVIGTDLRARRMSELVRPIEDLAIKPLATNKARREPHGIEDFMRFLQPLMKDEVKQRYEEFRNGTVILLLKQLFQGTNGTHHLIEVEQEILDFGMDRESFAEGVVNGLKVSSRAEMAGLKNGDRIVWSSHDWRCVDHFDEAMVLVVERDVEKDGVVKPVQMKVKYWPRAFEKAKSWQMVEKTDEEREQAKNAQEVKDREVKIGEDKNQSENEGKRKK